MISYELATKLANAGFPQRNNRYEIPPWAKFHNHGSWCENGKTCNGREFDTPYAPTLSELIEACGDDFHLLEKEPNTPDYWRCLTIVKGREIRTKGLTPEEAVAHLYLEIAKNKKVC